MSDSISDAIIAEKARFRSLSSTDDDETRHYYGAWWGPHGGHYRVGGVTYKGPKTPAPVKPHAGPPTATSVKPVPEAFKPYDAAAVTVSRATAQLAARGPNERERGIIIDQQGNVVLDKIGTDEAVRWYGSEIPKMKDAHLLHSHPNGSVLSPADLYSAGRVNVASVTAIGPHELGTTEWYTMFRPKSGYWPNMRGVWNTIVAPESDRQFIAFMKAHGLSPYTQKKGTAGYDEWYKAALEGTRVSYIAAQKKAAQSIGAVFVAAQWPPAAINEAAAEPSATLDGDLTYLVLTTKTGDLRLGPWPQYVCDLALADAKKQPWFVSGRIAATLEEARADDDDTRHYYGAWHGPRSKITPNTIARTREKAKRPYGSFDHYPPEMQASLTAAMGEVVPLEDYERAIVLDATGKRTLVKDGSKSMVPLEDESLHMKDQALVHNHPSDMPLSNDDISLAVQADMASIHAIGTGENGEHYRYSIYRPPGGWPKSLTGDPTGANDRYMLAGPFAAGHVAGEDIWRKMMIDAGQSTDALGPDAPAAWAKASYIATLQAMNIDRAAVAKALGTTYERVEWGQTVSEHGTKTLPSGSINPNYARYHPGSGGSVPTGPADDTGQNLGGSTGAKLITVKGKPYVEKRGASAEHVREEYAANQMYDAAGVAVPSRVLIETPSGPVMRSDYIAGVPLNRYWTEASAADRAKVVADLQSGFAMDALMGNWDSIGLVGDNIIVRDNLLPFRVDNGGSLRFRAQGGPKGDRFGSIVGELQTMTDLSKGSWASKVFAGIKPSALRRQIVALDARRSAILAAAPPDLRDLLGLRLDYMLRQVGLREATSDDEHHYYGAWLGPRARRAAYKKPVRQQEKAYRIAKRGTKPVTAQSMGLAQGKTNLAQSPPDAQAELVAKLDASQAVGRDPFFSEHVLNGHAEGIGAVRDYVNGEPPIAEVWVGEYGTAVMPPEPGQPYGAGRHVYLKKGGEPVYAGRWMDFPEDHWNISKAAYRALPEAERAAMEAREQATKWVPQQYAGRWLETYAPIQYDEAWLGVKRGEAWRSVPTGWGNLTFHDQWPQVRREQQALYDSLHPHLFSEADDRDHFYGAWRGPRALHPDVALRPAGDMMVSGLDQLSLTQRSAFDKAMARIPAKDKAFLRARGVAIHIDQKVEYGAQFQPDDATIHVDPGMTGALGHEVGHAMDWALGWPSRSAPWLALVRDEKVPAVQGLHTAWSTAQEAWADAYNAGHGGDTPMWLRSGSNLIRVTREIPREHKVWVSEAQTDDTRHFYGRWRGPRNPGVRHVFPANPGGVPPATFDAMSAAWNDLSTRYPVDTISGVAWSARPSAYGSTVAGPPLWNVMGDRGAQAGGINYSQSSASEKDSAEYIAMQQRIEKSQGFPGNVYQRGSASLVAHEYGHAVDTYLLDVLGTDYRRWRADLHRGERNAATARISAYAGSAYGHPTKVSAPNEGVAEAFSLYWSTGSDPYGIAQWLDKGWPKVQESLSDDEDRHFYGAYRGPRRGAQPAPAKEPAKAAEPAKTPYGLTPQDKHQKLGWVNPYNFLGADTMPDDPNYFAPDEGYGLYRGADLRMAQLEALKAGPQENTSGDISRKADVRQAYLYEHQAKENWGSFELSMSRGQKDKALEQMVFNWGDAADGPPSALMQASVRDVFGGSGQLWSRGQPTLEVSDWSRKAVQAMYDSTQKKLAKMPTMLTLFRGVGSATGSRNLLESWTTDRKMAESFANGNRSGVRNKGFVLTTTVPHDAVFMLVPGDEREMVLFGWKTGDVKVAGTAER